MGNYTHGHYLNDMAQKGARRMAGKLNMTPAEDRWVKRMRRGYGATRVWRTKKYLKFKGLHEDCVPGVCGRDCWEEFWKATKPAAKKVNRRRKA